MMGGNRTQVVEVDGSSIEWLYDNAYRLEREERFDEAQTPITYTEFAYDDGGNRTEVDEDGLSTLYTYNDDDQIITAGTAAYTYDERGNLATITDGSDVTTYGFDAQDRLESVTLPDTTTVSNDYDHDGRRIGQTVDSTETNYLWDEGSMYGDVVLETDGSGNALASYVLADTRLVSQERTSTSHYYLTDGQHSVRALTNGSANVTDTYDYDAFGTLYDSFSSTTNSYLYTGQQFDAATGLYSLRARFYDPSAGRFLSRDMWPIDTFNPVELNRYGYAANNPINRFDPSGNQGLVSYALNTSKTVLAHAALGFYGSGIFAMIFYLLARMSACGSPAQKWAMNTDIGDFVLEAAVEGAKYGALNGVLIAFLPAGLGLIIAGGRNAKVGMDALKSALEGTTQGACRFLQGAAGIGAIASGAHMMATGFTSVMGTMNTFIAGGGLGGGQVGVATNGAGSFSGGSGGSGMTITGIGTVYGGGIMTGAGTATGAASGTINDTANTIDNTPTPEEPVPDDDDGFINDRARELATEPHKYWEGNTGARLEQQRGIELRVHDENLHPDDVYRAGDWVDTSGKTYDGVSPLPNNFNLHNVEQSIRGHWLKVGTDYIVIDTTPLTPSQALQVRSAAQSFSWGGRHPDLIFIP